MRKAGIKSGYFGIWFGKENVNMLSKVTSVFSKVSKPVNLLITVKTC